MPKQKIDFRRGLSSTIPSEIIPGTILIETDTGNMYIDDTETSRVQIKDSTKLPLTGGVVSGNLRVNGRLQAGGTVWLLGSSTQIANAEFVTGPTLNNNRILDVGVPTSDTDAANKAYVDSSISSAIGSVTSFAIDSNGGSGYASLQALQSAHPTGEVGVFYLVVSSDSSSSANLFDEYFWTGSAYEKAGGFGDVSSGDLATKEELENYLPLDGSSSMTGDLNLGSHKITNLATPTLNTDAVNKQYVDIEFQAIESEFATALQSYLQLKGGTMQGSLNMGGFSLTNLDSPANASDAATKQYVDSQISGAGQGDFLSNGSIPMTGNLQMNNHRITGVATPTENTDAVNKQYVDEHSSSGGADESIYTANGISIQPSNQPFNIGASSGSAGDVGHQVNELYAQYGWFSSLNSESIDASNLSVSGFDFARKLSSGSNNILEIGDNDLASTSSPDHVNILAKQGINLILPSSYSLKFVYDEIISGCHLLPSPNGTINIGARNIRFNEIFCNTINAESKVLTDRISPITNATSLDLSGFGSLKLRNGEVILDTYSGSDHVLELGSSVYSRTSLVSDSKIVLPLTGNGGSELYYATINRRRYLFENNPLVVCDLGTSTGRFGTVYCESVSESSDAESKSDIHYLDSNNRIATRSVTQDSEITTQDVINFVKNLDPATFIYKRDGVSTVEQALSEDPDIIHLGIIANDIEKDSLFNYVASKVTSTIEDKTEGEIEKTVYSIKPASLAVAALTTCKYLLNKVEELENKLKA